VVGRRMMRRRCRLKGRLGQENEDDCVGVPKKGGVVGYHIRVWTHSSIANPTTVNCVRNGFLFSSATTSNLLSYTSPFSYLRSLLVPPIPSPVLRDGHSDLPIIRKTKGPWKATKRMDHLPQDQTCHPTSCTSRPAP
jgi:hypothetical protein